MYILSSSIYHFGKHSYYHNGYYSYMAKKAAPQKFIDWLTGQMEAHNLGIRETAKRIGVSHPTISEIVTYHNMPSFETCIALAKAFGVSPLYVLQMADLLPVSAAYDKLSEDELELLYRYRNASPERKEDLQRFADLFSSENHKNTPAPSAAKLNPKTQPR